MPGLASESALSEDAGSVQRRLIGELWSDRLVKPLCSVWLDEATLPPLPYLAKGSGEEEKVGDVSESLPTRSGSELSESASLSLVPLCWWLKGCLAAAGLECFLADAEALAHHSGELLPLLCSSVAWRLLCLCWWTNPLDAVDARGDTWAAASASEDATLSSAWVQKFVTHLPCVERTGADSVQVSTSQYVPSTVLSSWQTVNAQVFPLQVDEVVGPAQTGRCLRRVLTVPQFMAWHVWCRTRAYRPSDLRINLSRWMRTSKSAAEVRPAKAKQYIQFIRCSHLHVRYMWSLAAGCHMIWLKTW